MKKNSGPKTNPPREVCAPKKKPKAAARKEKNVNEQELKMANQIESLKAQVANARKAAETTFQKRLDEKSKLLEEAARKEKIAKEQYNIEKELRKRTQAKLDEKWKLFEEAARKENIVQAQLSQFAKQIAEMHKKAELNKQFDDLSQSQTEMAQEIYALKAENKKLSVALANSESARRDAEGKSVQLHANVHSLTQQLEGLNRRLCEEREKNNRIDETTGNPAELDIEEELQLPKKVLDVVNHNNIPHGHPADTEGTIPFIAAMLQLKNVFLGKDDEWLARHREDCKMENLDCGACKMKRKNLKSSVILKHFFSKGHEEKAVNSAVSLVAFEYWKRKLESIPTSQEVE